MEFRTPNKNLGQNFKIWAEKFSKNTALIQLNEYNEMIQTSYWQLKADVDAWVEYFRKNGVEPGDRVAMIASKCPDHFRFFYACWTMGAIAVPICETLGDKEMAFIIKDSSPKILITDKQFLKKVESNAQEIKIVIIDDIATAPATPDFKPQEAAETSEGETAALIYTSGSTGMPKGVMLSHKAILVNADNALRVFQLKPTDRLISILPYWHAYALTCEIACVPMGGGIVAVARDMKDFKKNIATYKPTLMIVVPRVIELLKASIDKKIETMPPKARVLIEKAIYNASRIFTARPKLDGGILRIFTHHLFYDPLVFRKFRAPFGGALRCVVSGGAPLDLELQIFFKYLGIPLLQGYGLTEASPIVSSNTEEDHLLGSIGKVFHWLTPEGGGDYTFKDENGNMGKNLHGQLMLKGDCVMKGYWHHTDASAKSFEDGWLNTGDVAYEKDGFLFIDGRKGNMIVLIGGEKLHPEHVEDAIKGSPLITEAMVIGEKCKNVYALVNVNKDAVKGLPDDEVRAKVKADVQELSKHLAAYQKPKDVLVLPDFSIDEGTLTATLKVRRHKINEIHKDKIEEFLKSNGEEIATKREVEIASSKILESLADATLGNNN